MVDFDKEIVNYLTNLHKVLDMSNEFLWDGGCFHTAESINDDLHLFDNGGKICFVENYDEYGLKDYHCFIYYNGKYYDTSLAKGSEKMSDLKFFKVYMPSSSESFLKKHVVIVDNEKDLYDYNDKIKAEFKIASDRYQEGH